MSSNPFVAPKAKVGDSELSENLMGYTPKEIKKLYYRSCNVTGIAVLLVLGVVGLAGVMLGGEMANKMPLPVLLTFLVFFCVAAVGAFMRTSWGRVCGIISCCFMLFSIPLGTIVGIIGLFAFINAKVLFGTDRVTHKEIKFAFKELKRAGSF
ncbi:MAG TPA: hypothetical protein VJ001_08010 [Rhodocyclaceae bacterium]|nr:hypothetical protein [Rhodocyclaceae bacterium]